MLLAPYSTTLCNECLAQWNLPRYFFSKCCLRPCWRACKQSSHVVCPIWHTHRCTNRGFPLEYLPNLFSLSQLSCVGSAMCVLNSRHACCMSSRSAANWLVRATKGLDRVACGPASLRLSGSVPALAANVLNGVAPCNPNSWTMVSAWRGSTSQVMTDSLPSLWHAVIRCNAFTWD